MKDRVATIEDFRHYGTLFGMECAAAAKRMRADGASKKAIRAHVIDGMIPVKHTQLQAIADAPMIDSFMRAAGATAYAALNGEDLLGILNRRWRRGASRGQSCSVIAFGKSHPNKGG